MKNTITYSLIILLQCLIYGQDKKINLVGTWSTDDQSQTITIDSLLNGTYIKKSNGRTITLNLIANELPNYISIDSLKATAVSISLMNVPGEYPVYSTMTGQAYVKNQKQLILQVFHVLKTNQDPFEDDLNRGETLFFTKIDDTPPLVIDHDESALEILSDNSRDHLIGPWLDSNELPGLNIVYIKKNNISATYNYRDPNTKEELLIKLKGYIQQQSINKNYCFSLSGISHSFATTTKDKVIKVNSFSMSLVGEIIEDNDGNFRMKSSMNLAHAYGKKVNYSAVRSKGAYFTKSKNSNFAYQQIQNSMERLPFTNNGATNWFSDMKIGSTQILKMAIDTGGNFDWVNSTQCTENTCTKYNHSQFDTISTSFKMIDRTITKHDWGPWGSSEANLGFDLVKIDPTKKAFPKEINLIKKFIPTADGNMDKFKELLWDGALAIPSFSSGGKPNDPNYRISNIMLDLVTSGTIDPTKVTISFYYDKETKKGNYVIGNDQVDTTKVDIKSKITLNQKNYSDSEIPEDPYAVSYLWSTALHSVKVGGEIISGIDPSKTVFAFDTGSSSLKGDSIKMIEVKDKLIKGAENSPTIEYSMGVNSHGERGRFVIGPKQYKRTIQQGDFKNTDQIQVQTLASVPNLWVHGTTFLEDVVSEFTYDISFNKKGELVLKANNIALYNKVGGPQIIQPQFTCEEEYTDSGGLSGNYQDNTSETIVYRPGAKGEKVALLFDYIDIEKKYDFLYIYDGPNDKAQLIKEYSGNYKDEKIISTHPSGALTVKFTSDLTLNKRGWKAKVNKCSTKIQNHCKEEFTDSGGLYGNYKNYENNFFNPYIFHPEKAGNIVALDFEYIDLDFWDILIVYDGPTANPFNIKKIFNGKHENVKITSTHHSGAITAVFVSGFWTPKRGWKANVDKCTVKTNYRKSKIENEQKVISKDPLIYPNPVTSILHIAIPSSEETLGDSFISITDVLGKVVGNYTYKESDTSLDLDLSNLSEGSYFIKITNKKGVTTKKIIKQ